MNIKSGIILAGGAGTRLLPLTNVINKHLVTVHNQFIIDYPLNTLKQMGIENLTVVLGGPHFDQIVSHIKDGKHLGMNINYVYQNAPAGIAQAINLCERFIDDKFVVILGDNIFENSIEFKDSFRMAQVVFNKHSELNRFGVASLRHNRIYKIEEKPKKLDPTFNQYAITGCYLFDLNFFKYFKKIKPSLRGEFEITDIICKYHQNDDLDYTFTNGLWSDAGTHESINYLNDFFYNK